MVGYEFFTGFNEATDRINRYTCPQGDILRFKIMIGFPDKDRFVFEYLHKSGGEVRLQERLEANLDHESKWGVRNALFVSEIRERLQSTEPFRLVEDPTGQDVFRVPAGFSKSNFLNALATFKLQHGDGPVAADPAMVETFKMHMRKELGWLPIQVSAADGALTLTCDFPQPVAA